MFTGLIRTTGRLIERRRTPSGARLIVQARREGLGPLAIGDSVAVSGACLTLVALSGDRFEFDAVEETLRLTTFNSITPGRGVNLEPAIRAGEPFGGHFVSGHVDGVATCRFVRRSGDGAQLGFALKPELLRDVFGKGSVTVDGVSLTVASLEPGDFNVAVIPHTLEATTLRELREGGLVNIETDLLVKAVRRVAESASPPEGRLSADFLRENGFA